MHSEHHWMHLRIGEIIHVTLYCNNYLVPLPQWFHKCTTCTLNRIAHAVSFLLGKWRIIFWDLIIFWEELSSAIATELEELRYQKHPQYSNQILRSALNMRYSFLQAQKEYNIPSLSYWRGIDNMKALAALKANGSISEEVILMFDENLMYLQQCDQYSGRKVEGSDEILFQ